jgi:hypothetical protein
MERRTVLFRRYLFLGVGAAALLWVLGDPGQLQAQRFRGGSRPGFRPMVTPGFRGRTMPGFGFHRRFSFDPRFRGRSFDRRCPGRNGGDRRGPVLIPAPGP